MRLRSRRQARAPGTPHGPIVYSLDKFVNFNARRGRPWVRACLVVVSFTIVFVCLMIHLYPEKVKDTATSTWSAIFAARCNCTLSVISLLKGGQPHSCKDYCSDQLQWTLAPKPHTTPKSRYGTFAIYGNCRKEELLSLKNNSMALIPRISKSHMPDFQSLLDVRFRNTEVLLIGGLILKQVFDVLPSVLDRGTFTMTDEHVIYNATDGGKIQSIKQCVSDWKTKTQYCWRNDSLRMPCDCSMFTTLHWTESNTTIRILRGEGIEFDLNSTKHIYGSSYNIVKGVLYTKLALTASVVVIDFDVVANDEAVRNTQGFSNLLQFIQQFSIPNKVVYRLAMPQHFSTKHPSSTFGDEAVQRSSSTCVATATHRHWTDEMARNTLKGVDVIDLFRVAATQGHLHSHRRNDCSYWCLVYDMFYVFWATLADAVQTSSPRTAASSTPEYEGANGGGT